MSSDAVYIIRVSLQLSQHNQHIFGEAAIGTAWLCGYGIPCPSAAGPSVHYCTCDCFATKA